jgi:hypothetical protein
MASRVLATPHPKAIFIGGDNVYPEKDAAGARHYSLARLRRGAEQMEALHVPMYLALGNHNIVDPDILREELALSWTIPNNYYCVRFPAPSQVQIVVLDTNLYQGPTYTRGARAQDDWLSRIIRHSPTIIVQHEPLAGYKQKKKATYVELPNATRLVSVLAQAPHLVAVLSADIHLYQDLTLYPRLHVPIHQVIVGTGGAELDDLPAEATNPDIHMNAGKKTYGYIEVRGLRKTTRPGQPLVSLDYVFHDVGGIHENPSF